MSERVLKVLEGEVKKLEHNNDVMLRDAAFLRERAAGHDAAIADNKIIIAELKAEILAVTHRISDELDCRALAEAGQMVFESTVVGTVEHDDQLDREQMTNEGEKTVSPEQCSSRAGTPHQCERSAGHDGMHENYGWHGRLNEAWQ